MMMSSIMLIIMLMLMLMILTMLMMLRLSPGTEEGPCRALRESP